MHKIMFGCQRRPVNPGQAVKPVVPGQADVFRRGPPHLGDDMKKLLVPAALSSECWQGERRPPGKCLSARF